MVLFKWEPSRNHNFDNVYLTSYLLWVARFFRIWSQKKSDIAFVNKSINRYEINIGNQHLSVLHLTQQESDIEVKEESGHFVLLDGKDCEEMFLFASICKYISENNSILFLERKNDTFADLVLFNGASNPIQRKDVKQIKKAIKQKKALVQTLPILSEEKETKWEGWKYEKQLSVQADQHLVLINASKLGLQLLVRQCLHLANSYSGHSHFDWWSTSSSPELIIRNIARN